MPFSNNPQKEDVAADLKQPGIIMNIKGLVDKFNNKSFSNGKIYRINAICKHNDSGNEDIPCCSECGKTRFCKENSRLFFLPRNGLAQSECGVQYDENGVPTFHNIEFAKGFFDEAASLPDNNVLKGRVFNKKDVVHYLKNAYIDSVYITINWDVNKIVCRYPENEYERILSCFYYTVPETMEKTADALFEKTDLNRNNSCEITAFQKAVYNIIGIYFDWNRKKELYGKYPDNEEIITGEKIQEIFALIFKFDDSYDKVILTDMFVPAFDTVLTKCYDSVRRIMKKHRNKSDAEKYRVIGIKTIELIKNERGEFRQYIKM